MVEVWEKGLSIDFSFGPKHTETVKNLIERVLLLLKYK